MRPGWVVALVLAGVLVPVSSAGTVGAPPIADEQLCTNPVFSDDFEPATTTNVQSSPYLAADFLGFAKWDVTRPGVDLVWPAEPSLPAGFVYDSQFVDMEGSSSGGQLWTKPQHDVEVPAGGTITVQWRQAGNNRHPSSDRLTVSLPGLARSIVDEVPFDEPWNVRTFTVPGGSVATSTAIVFSSEGDNARGVAIDDVRVCIAGPFLSFATTGGDSCQQAATEFHPTAVGMSVTNATWHWDFGNGQTSTARHPSLRLAGTYNVRLTVVNATGLTLSVTKTVHAPNLQCCLAASLPAAYQVRSWDAFRLSLNVSGENEGYQALSLPAGAHLDPDGTVWWDAGAVAAGEHEIRAKAVNGACELVLHVAVSVVPPRGPPVEDRDRDGINDDADNCPARANRGQEDRDDDGTGDACDGDPCPDGCGGVPPPVGQQVPATSDRDSDGVPDKQDNCPRIANPDQADQDLDGFGDGCDDDQDGDGIVQGGEPGAILDNCPGQPNPGQEDVDLDGLGDACDDGRAASRLPRSVEPAGSATQAASAGTGVAGVLLIFGAVCRRRKGTLAQAPERPCHHPKARR